ncbi:MAG: calcium/sodium antiporter [Spirochaetota bacterium]
MGLLLLVLGIAPLLFGANLFVSGASSTARRFNVPPMAIGLTIVAFGTSAPELGVNVLAAAQGNPDVVLGNIIGSNLANIFAILGVAALIRALPVNRKTTWIEIPLAGLAALALLTASLDPVLEQQPAVIGRAEGILFLFFFVIFLAYVASMMKSDNNLAEIPESRWSVGLSLLATAGGLAMLIGGSQLVVTGATQTARMLGVSERVIASTVVAIGTSLPELITSVVAARKGETDIAVGNVVGSNIFNTFLVLGISAIVQPIPVSAAFSGDLLINLAAAALLFIFVFTGKGRAVTRGEGIVFLAAYGGYITLLLVR